MTRAQDVELGLRFQERSGLRLAYAERATARHRNRSTQRGFFRQQLGWAYGAGPGRRQVRGHGRPPGQAAPHPRARPHPCRGSPSSSGPASAGAAAAQWIEDAWFDFLRQLAWWIGARIGLRRGARIWRLGREAEPDRST